MGSIMNPYEPPRDAIGFRIGGNTLGPARRAEIQRELRKLNVLSFGLGVPGLLLQVTGRVMDSWLLSLAGLVLFVAGMVFYTKMRGRHIAWSLLAFSSCIGLVILYFLPKRCLNCSSENSYRAGQCDSCGCPLGS
jgi:hypothetical protein